MAKRALVSVSDKTGLVDFVKGLQTAGWEIIATGGTQKLLEDSGVKTIGISDVTGFPEICDGRVKTLHPKVHGGLLARRDEPSHLQALQENGIEFIDLVCELRVESGQWTVVYVVSQRNTTWGTWMQLQRLSATSSSQQSASNA